MWDDSCDMQFVPEKETPRKLNYVYQKPYRITYNRTPQLLPQITYKQHETTL